VLYFFFFFVGLGFELTLAKQPLYCLSHTSSPLSLVVLEMGGGLMNYLPGLALNCDLPDLSLPSN
jgi:hypothetical protein